MESKEYLLIQAISSLLTTGTYMFTAEQLLTVADISIKELEKAKEIFGNRADEIVKHFSNKIESEVVADAE